MKNYTAVFLFINHPALNKFHWSMNTHITQHLTFNNLKFTH